MKMFEPLGSLSRIPRNAAIPRPRETTLANVKTKTKLPTHQVLRGALSGFLRKPLPQWMLDHKGNISIASASRPRIFRLG
jgi:hypothetical protein